MPSSTASAAPHSGRGRSPVEDIRLHDYRHWKPEVQEQLLEKIREREQAPWRPFYCQRGGCNGHPHCEVLADQPQPPCEAAEGHRWTEEEDDFKVPGVWHCHTCGVLGTLIDDWAWEHARADQHPPRWSDPWLTWLLAGGRGCVAPWTLVYDAASRSHRRIADIATPLVVDTLAGSAPTDGAPFAKGWDHLWTVVTEDGSRVSVTREHRFLTPTGWRRLADVHVGQLLAAAPHARPDSASRAQSASLEDALRSSRTAEGSLADCPRCHRCGGRRPPLAAGAAPAPAPSPVDGGARSRDGSPRGGRVDGSARSRACRPSSHLSRSGSAQAVVDSPGAALLGVPSPVGQPPLSSPAAVRSPDTSGPAQTTSGAASRRSRSTGPGQAGACTCGSAHPLPPVGVEQFGASSLPLPPRLEGSPHLHTSPASESRPYPDATSWTRIVSISYCGESWYYDLTVPGAEHYAAEGLYHHNSGKTRTGAEITHHASEISPRLILIAPTGPDLRETMIEGVSGIRATAPPGKMPTWEPSKKKLTWPNGAIAQGFSAEEPDRLRGPQCFAADTMIRTWDGEVAIQHVNPGDEVWTRHGLRVVTAVHAGVRPVIDRGMFEATPDHKVWTADRGWTQYQFISPDDTLVTWCPTCTPRQAATSSSLPAAAPCTTPGGCGSRSTARSRMAGTFITSTSTEPTTGSTTSPPSPERSTSASTPPRPGRTSASPVEGTSSSSEVALVGDAYPASESPTENPCAEPTSAATRGPKSPASTVVRPSGRAEGDSAPSDASTSVERIVYDLTVAEHPEFFANGILVHNSGFIWADEPAHYPNTEAVWSNMLFGHRVKNKRGFRPKIVATSTPKPTKWMKELVADEKTKVTTVSTFANLSNLSDTFRETVSRYEGTRIGLQELEGQLLGDVEGAMWDWDMYLYEEELPTAGFKRVVVGLDPAGSANKRSDETGIIVVALDHADHVWVLADYTGKYSPAGWASKAIHAFEVWQADEIVVERNYGGDMVRHTLETSAEGKGVLAAVKDVDSRRGKEIRATPVVALYEKKKVHHLTRKDRTGLAELREEQTTWEPAGGSPSPNRIDAEVHGITRIAKKIMPASVTMPSRTQRGGAGFPALASAGFSVPGRRPSGPRRSSISISPARRTR